MANDKRYWKFQNREMIKRDRNKIQPGERFLETLKTTGKGSRSNQHLTKELEDKRVGEVQSGPPNRLEASETQQVCCTDR